VITREAVKTKKLVYLAVTSKRLAYPKGNSRIAYIGTTKKGSDRVARSAANRANELLDLRGVSSLEFFVVTCHPRQRVKTWRKLESGLVLAFKDLFGSPSKCNEQGKNMKWANERDYFTLTGLKGVVKKYS